MHGAVERHKQRHCDVWRRMHERLSGSGQYLVAERQPSKPTCLTSHDIMTMRAGCGFLNVFFLDFDWCAVPAIEWSYYTTLRITRWLAFTHNATHTACED